MDIRNIDPKTLSIIAFLIGITITDNLTSTEQNAVGNFIMLIGQTICTNGSFYFNSDWKNNINRGNIDNNFNMGIDKNTLKKTFDILNGEINKL